MKTPTNQTWTTEQLVQLSQSLGGGYMPGTQPSQAASGDRWTAQRHIQASALRAQAYL